MNIEVITQPTVEPVTDGEAFFSLKLTTDPNANVSSDPQLAEVRRCVRAAREQCEQYTNRAFIQQTLRMTLNPYTWRGERRGLLWYMNGGANAWHEIELLRPPLISVTAVRYYDDANQLQTVDQDDYFVVSGLVPKIRFVEGFASPSTYVREDAIQVEYVVGYPPTTDSPPNLRGNVPDSIKQAILVGAQMEFDRLTPAEREAYEKAMHSLLSSYRVVTL